MTMRRRAHHAGGAPSPSPHSRREAEIEDIVSALRSYGVLTRARLAEISGAMHWPDRGFNAALRQAVSTGRVRRLGNELYELAPPDVPADLPSHRG